MATTNALPIDQIKAAMLQQWTAGDFGVIAKTIAAVAEAFVQGLALPAGARVLDVACGTGNVTIPLARAGCHATGVDIAPNLLDQARARAREEGLDVEFDKGDAEELPYADATFDGATSMFGAMFAPRPVLVTQEFARVLKPGGLLAMANWTPEGFSGAMFRVSAHHVPPPPGLAKPVSWGVEEVARERLAPFFEEIRCQRVPVDFDLPVSPAHVVAFFRQNFGPTKLAFSRLSEEGQAAMAHDLEALWREANVSATPERHTLVRNEYLEVRAVRR